jgi:hypothetical protein
MNTIFDLVSNEVSIQEQMLFPATFLTPIFHKALISTVQKTRRQLHHCSQVPFVAAPLLV